MLSCLSSHYDELSEVCKRRMDDRESRQQAIPGTFIESQYYSLTRLITTVTLVILTIPLLLSAWAYKSATALQRLIAANGPKVKGVGWIILKVAR